MFSFRKLQLGHDLEMHIFNNHSSLCRIFDDEDIDHKITDYKEFATRKDARYFAAEEHNKAEFELATDSTMHQLLCPDCVRDLYILRW